MVRYTLPRRALAAILETRPVLADDCASGSGLAMTSIKSATIWVYTFSFFSRKVLAVAASGVVRG